MIVICHGTSLKKLGTCYIERLKREMIYVYIVMAELRCYMAETKITL